MNTIACTTCAKAFHSVGGNAAGFSILFLLVVILTVLGTVSFLLVRMIRREQASLDPQFQDDFNPQDFS